MIAPAGYLSLSAMTGLSRSCLILLPSKLLNASSSSQGHQGFPGPARASVNNKYCTQNKIVNLAIGWREFEFLYSSSLVLHKSL